MNKYQTLISVIIPVYNAGNYLRQTLQSVIYQTYNNWECILINDGSTDNSSLIISEFCKADKRFKTYNQSNLGASAARNFGLEKSKGDYIQYLDADDVILPNKIDIMLTEYRNLNNNLILYSNMVLGNQDNIYETIPLQFELNKGTDINFEFCYKRYALDFGITPACFLFPKKTIENVQWNVILGPSEDWDYFLQLLDKGYVFRFIPEVFVIYRNTPQSYSKNLLKSFYSAYYVLTTWAAKKQSYWFTYSCRISKKYKKSILLFLLRKTKKIFHPKLTSRNFSFKQNLMVIIIYPLTIYFVCADLLKAALKRIHEI